MLLVLRPPMNFWISMSSGFSLSSADLFHSSSSFSSSERLSSMTNSSVSTFIIYFLGLLSRKL
eukprot:UN20849